MRDILYERVCGDSTDGACLMQMLATVVVCVRRATSYQNCAHFDALVQPETDIIKMQIY